MEALGYNPLPDFPIQPPDPSVRDVEDYSWGVPRSGSGKKDKGFYDSDEESSKSSDFYSSITGSDKSGSEDSESDSEEGISCF